MKKIAVVLVIAVLALYAVPAFAGCGTCAKPAQSCGKCAKPAHSCNKCPKPVKDCGNCGKSASCKGEKSLFQTAANEISCSKMPDRFAVKPVVKDTVDAAKYVGDKKVPVFQDTAKAIDEQSAIARNESAR